MMGRDGQATRFAAGPKPNHSSSKGIYEDASRTVYRDQTTVIARFALRPPGFRRCTAWNHNRIYDPGQQRHAELLWSPQACRVERMDPTRSGISDVSILGRHYDCLLHGVSVEPRSSKVFDSPS